MFQRVLRRLSPYWLGRFIPYDENIVGLNLRIGGIFGRRCKQCRCRLDEPPEQTFDVLVRIHGRGQELHLELKGDAAVLEESLDNDSAEWLIGLNREGQLSVAGFDVGIEGFPGIGYTGFCFRAVPFLSNIALSIDGIAAEDAETLCSADF